MQHTIVKTLFAGLMLCSAPGWASAQSPAPGDASTSGTPQVRQPRDFERVKARRLEELAKHLALVQRHQACVQAATDFEQLEACRVRHDH